MKYQNMETLNVRNPLLEKNFLYIGGDVWLALIISGSIAKLFTSISIYYFFFCTVSTVGNIRTCWLLLPSDEICFVTLNYKIMMASMAETSVDGGCAYVLFDFSFKKNLSGCLKKLYGFSRRFTC